MMKPEHFVAVCRQLLDNPSATQRDLAMKCKFSLGLVNQTIKNCISAGYLMHKAGSGLLLTETGSAFLEGFRVKNGIILAAGFGSRCVPLTYETPKGLLEVYSQPMIERQIEQLQKKGISEIILVVGYKKEKFDYLIDRYNVKLVYNPEYATKNNLASLYHVLPYLSSSYLLMSDHWIEENIFNTYEARSWYSCLYFDGQTDEWCVTPSQGDRISSISIGGRDAYGIVGPAYLSPSFSAAFKRYVAEYYEKPGTEDYYWEHVLREQIDALPIFMNVQTGNVYEFENLEELRMFDPSYNIASNNKIMESIASFFNIPEAQIRDLHPLKVGMTNRTFTFTYDDTRYIMRIPGEGTDMLIDRAKECEVYQAISPFKISDDIVCIDPRSGYKISVFLADAHVCDPSSARDVRVCMKKLREFHGLKIKVAHSFDLFERIEFYESLWSDPVSSFRDYGQTKQNIMQLQGYLDSIEKDRVLSHIDAVPDNFLIMGGDDLDIRLIDWEYAGMQDPHIDIAMFAIYSFYDKRRADELIDYYFDGWCPEAVRTKIYAYMAACGLLWSNWCEYKRQVGVEFGEYALRQYRYAKDFYIYFKERQYEDSQ